MANPDLTWDDLNATRLTARTGYTLADDGTLTLWHWCTTTNQWTPTEFPATAVTSTNPLDLNVRINLTCCGLYAHIHDDCAAPDEAVSSSPPHVSSAGSGGR